MEETLLAKLRADFLEWSGGFEPESPEQITVYMMTAMDAEIAILADEGRGGEGEIEIGVALSRWMEESV